MRLFSIFSIAMLALSCSSSKPESKYDFSNVQSTSLGAKNYNNSPAHIMKDTVIVIQLNN